MSDKDLATWQNWNQGLDPLDLKSLADAELNKRDVIGKLISGELFGVEFRRNFQRCAFRNAQLSDLDWKRVDYKDSVFFDVDVRDSAIGGGSTVSCTFSRCRFVRCSFEDAAVHDCAYDDCEFIECSFSDSMIRNSQLIRCRFDNCTTSNKLFDGCRLYENEFRSTWLDFRAILDNFGLDSRQLPISSVREDRAYPSSTPWPIDKMLASTQLETLSPFETIKLQFYLAGGELLGSDLVDKAFQPEAWILLVRAPVNLMRLLQDFSEFIFYLYQADRLQALFVLKLTILAEAIWQGFRDHPTQLQVGQAAAGTYLQCLQRLSDLEAVIADRVEGLAPEEITYRTFDEASDLAIDDLVKSFRASLPNATIEVRPRNSPVDIVLSNLPLGGAIFLVTLFFSTRTRVELSRLRRRVPHSRQEKMQIVSISLGGAQEGSLRSALSVQATLPGTTIFRLDVDYSSALVEKIKKVIKALV